MMMAIRGRWKKKQVSSDTRVTKIREYHHIGAATAAIERTGKWRAPLTWNEIRHAWPSKSHTTHISSSDFILLHLTRDFFLSSLRVGRQILHQRLSRALLYSFYSDIFIPLVSCILLPPPHPSVHARSQPCRFFPLCCQRNMMTWVFQIRLKNKKATADSGAPFSLSHGKNHEIDTIFFWEKKNGMASINHRLSSYTETMGGRKEISEWICIFHAILVIRKGRWWVSDSESFIQWRFIVRPPSEKGGISATRTYLFPRNKNSSIDPARSTQCTPGGIAIEFDIGAKRDCPYGERLWNVHKLPSAPYGRVPIKYVCIGSYYIYYKAPVLYPPTAIETRLLLLMSSWYLVLISGLYWGNQQYCTISVHSRQIA